PALYAMLYDRIATTEGRPQRYGTQGTDCADGRYVTPRDVEDPENLDARRSAIGLQPMAQYLEQQNRLYGRCTPPPVASKRR
ncbi:MAG TPA: DUF6624 domain-containing protein, partial [Reyranella sp.]|nr:DUF6624 domain-containing protein [Reyranella sp.]